MRFKFHTLTLFENTFIKRKFICGNDFYLFKIRMTGINQHIKISLRYCGRYLKHTVFIILNKFITNFLCGRRTWKSIPSCRQVFYSELLYRDGIGGKYGG